MKTSMLKHKPITNECNFDNFKVDLLFSHLKALQAELKHDKACNVIVYYNVHFTNKENFELEN